MWLSRNVFSPYCQRPLFVRVEFGAIAESRHYSANIALGTTTKGAPPDEK